MTSTRASARPRWWSTLLYRGPSLEVLHDEYARCRRIDPSAPIMAAHTVTIAAPVPLVWRVLAQPERWSEIDSAIHEVHLDGGVLEGARFTWRNGKTRLASRFAVVDHERELTWTGTALGAKVVHRHVLRPTPDGGTELFTEESMAGPSLVLFFGSTKLYRALERWTSAITVAAESLRNCVEDEVFTP